MLNSCEGKELEVHSDSYSIGGETNYGGTIKHTYCLSLGQRDLAT